MRFAAMLKLPRAQFEAQWPRPTLLEFYVSYVVVNSGSLFANYVPDEQNGHRVSIQMEAFRLAWISFQTITGGAMIIDPAVRETCTWSQTLGLPKLELLQMCVILPAWQQVREKLQHASSEIMALTTVSDRKGVETWRRWCVGVCGSQMQTDTGIIPHSLLFDQPQRLRHSHPWWRKHAFKARLWIRDLSDRHGLSSEFVQFLVSVGVMARGNLLALIISQAAVKRRALTLIEYNRMAPMNCHVVSSAGAPRVSCVACKGVGPM
eukprot:6489993-Amphidinium_carterae.2